MLRLFRKSGAGFSRFASGPETLLRSQELEGVLTILTIWTNTGLWMYDPQLEKYHSILQLIDQKLDKSK